MAKGKYALTARTVQTLAVPGCHADGGGLYLRVSAAGNKTWQFRFQIAGRRREMGLGRVHDVTLAEARELAAEARRQVREGVDPIAAREAARASARSDVPTFAEAAARCIAALWMPAGGRASTRPNGQPP